MKNDTVKSFTEFKFIGDQLYYKEKLLPDMNKKSFKVEGNFLSFGFAPYMVLLVSNQGSLYSLPYGGFIEESQPQALETDLASFSMLDKGFYKDKNHLYYMGGPLTTPKSLDLNTVEVITNLPVLIYKDKDHVYMEGSIVPSADPNTFEYMDQCTQLGCVREGGCSLFFKDATHIFYGTTHIKEANPNSFKLINVDPEKYNDDKHERQYDRATYKMGLKGKDGRNTFFINERDEEVNFPYTYQIIPNGKVKQMNYEE